MTFLNSHDRVGQAMVLYWNEFPDGLEMEFELVNPFEAPVVREGSGLYQVYYAISVSEFEINGMKIQPESAIELHIAYRSFVKALQKLAPQLRIPCLRKYADGRNILMKLKKLDQRRICVSHQEPREQKEGQFEAAKMIYAMVAKEHRLA